MNLREKEKILKKTASELGVEPEQLPRLIKKFKKEIEEIEREIERLKLKFFSF